ncbi:hypothetical protein FHG87_002694 [Trinorchestia longiramus]|nr:hypothetical protein FHG87_002694 [Trinorchestia longiramus]
MWLSAALLLLAKQCSAPKTTGFVNHLILFYKGNYIAYGHGRSSERDLPECSGTEACNLWHERYWKPPLVERLCRCPGHTPCPIQTHPMSNNYTHQQNGENDQGGNQPLFTQHITNRAQLHFCQEPAGSNAILRCTDNEAGLEVTFKERYVAHNSRSQEHQKPAKSSSPAIVIDSHTRLLCRCDMPRYWKHRNTQLVLQARDTRDDPNKYRSRLLTEIHTYMCHKLPTCSSHEPCSAVRPDTHESYYTCSCPQQQLCLVPRNATAQRTTTHTYPHHDGPTKAGVCTPHYPTKPPRNYG